MCFKESFWEEMDCDGNTNILMLNMLSILCTGVSLVKFVRKRRKNYAY